MTFWSLPFRSRAPKKPYSFKGNCIDGLDGQTVSEFKWTPGVFSSKDYYSGTDSFYQITLQ